MAPFDPTLFVFSFFLFLLLGWTCPSQGQKVDYNFESPWDDLPRWSKDWTRHDWQTAIDRSMQANAYNFDRKLRESAPSSCASAMAKQGSTAASTQAASQPAVANWFMEASQRSGPKNYGYSNDQQGYEGGGSAIQQHPISVFQQHPNLAQFNRMQTTGGLMPDSNMYHSRLSSPEYESQQMDRFSKHPVETLPDLIEVPKSTNQYGFISPAGAMNSNMYTTSYRDAEAVPPQTTEDVKTTNPQYLDLANYYRQQIQQALADGKQLVTGIPNAGVKQQLGGNADKPSAQVTPVFTTNTFPLTALTFDPEEMKRVYGPYYVPPVFNLVQRQPNSLDGVSPAVVRDVLQYLLNQYQTGNYGVTSGFRNQRLLSDISKKHERILHGFAPLEKLPRQSMPQLPIFGGDNQLLPPNMYRTEKWEPKTNLVVHNPVNLGDLENSGAYNMGQYAPRSTPCSRHKRQLDDIWAYYPELTPGGGRMAEAMPMFPGMKSAMSMMLGSPLYGMEEPQMGRTAVPGYDNPFRQTMGGFGQPMSGLGQSMTGLGHPMGGMRYQQGYPDYYSNFQGRDAAPGLQQVIAGITQLVPSMTGNGLNQLKKR